jgi:hypothetical protein
MVGVAAEQWSVSGSAAAVRLSASWGAGGFVCDVSVRDWAVGPAVSRVLSIDASPHDGGVAVG